MTHVFMKGIDRQQWVQTAPSPNAHAAGVSMASDLRPAPYRHPFVFTLLNATNLLRYNVVQKGWHNLGSPALAGTFGAGATCCFLPSLGLTGSIGAGCTTTSIVTTTAMTSVAPNMLANRGGSGDYGYKIRIKGNAAGSSGKIEERWIVGNSSGTTPTIILDSALTFTPANGDTYEILAGRLWMLCAGTTAAGTSRTFEVASNTYFSTSTTNLPATVGTDSFAVALDEQYVPYDSIPGEGFVTGASTYDGTTFNCILATATGASSITGQAAAGDASVLANEYRNFQIRIVEDTVNVTAVGQRRIIASHTAGASPVYTLGAAWTVTPSANAKFVIEYPNLLLLRSSATTSVYTYNYSGASLTNGTGTIAADAWSATYFGVAGAAMAAGHMMFPSFGIRPDPGKYSRHSFVCSLRGGASTALDVLDIAGGTAGSWTTGNAYDGAVTTMPNTGSCACYAPNDNEGRFGYANMYTTAFVNQMYRFDVQNRVLAPVTPTDWIQSGTAAVGNRMATFCALDGTDKHTVVLLQSHLSTVAQELVVEV